MEWDKALCYHKAMKSKSNHVLDAVGEDALLWLISTAADPPTHPVLEARLQPSSRAVAERFRHF